MGTTGIRQSQHLAHLIEGFTRRIIQRFPQQFITPNPPNPDQLRMSTRYQQSHKRKRRRLIFQHWRQQMPFHMMHTHRWYSPPHGKTAPNRRPHQQRPDQARPGRVGHSLNLRILNSRFGDYLAHQWNSLANMIPRSQLRNHPTPLRMNIHLAI